MGEQELVNIITAMVETPFTFFEMKKEEIPADAAEFGETEFGLTPEAFDISKT